MNIIMFTNTFTPHVCGVTGSVQSLVDGLREQGHRVVLVAPVFDSTTVGETDVVRITTLQHFWDSISSAPHEDRSPPGRPIPRTITPNIVHAHHPFLSGDTALEIAVARGVPVIFTYHTRYELYSHYVRSHSP